MTTMQNSNPLSRIDRRSFLKKSALGAGAVILPGFVGGTSIVCASPSDRINIAIIGVAGRGQKAVIESMSHNVIALCDVDADRVALARAAGNAMGKQFNAAVTMYEKKGARWYSDYRVMFEELADKIDAVIISTPDHMHFPIALSAINLGKHVYCETPLTHKVEEARTLALAARRKGVITQMGNQVHSAKGTRQIRKWIKTGAIGRIKEVHTWTSRSALWWKNCVPNPGLYKMNSHRPKTLDWDSWLGIASSRSYDPAYLPSRWKAYNDFGNGVIGEMGGNMMDAAYWGLDLKIPTEIYASTIINNCYPIPVSAVVTYKFAERDKMPPVTYRWYEGSTNPSLTNCSGDKIEIPEEYQYNGSLIIGERGVILSDINNNNIEIQPNIKGKELQSDRSLEWDPVSRESHYEEFFNAIRDNRPASSDFSYAGPLTQTVLLGSIAQRLNRTLNFNPGKGRFINDDRANKLLGKEYPKGWILT